MPTYFVRPENALTRAEELLDVGKGQDALETLHDVIKARRHRSWTKTHEQIMLKHLELCVDLKKSHVAKDALWQYRNLVQQINVKSLEDVVAKFLVLAEEKVEKARQESQEMVEEIEDDLDQLQSPETLLLSAVSGADAHDRANRTVLSPWLRFLWDSYRNCLELLRNNAQVEQLYHKIARQAFVFCHKYQRRAEFRKLADNLRQHLNQIQRQQNYQHGVKLNSPETLAMMQETRLNQLEVAIKMELWQEAYKSSDDMYLIMELSREKDRRMVKAQTYVTYYDKLALVFWKSGGRLFHAAALLKLLKMLKDMKKSFSADDATSMATRLLLATLSIPPGAGNASDLAHHLDMEDVSIANQRQLAQLLALKNPPTRKLLLREIFRLNLQELAVESVAQLHTLLESQFSPLLLAKDIEKQLETIQQLNNDEYTQYLDAIREVATVKIIKQVSQVYDSITLERLHAIVPYYDENILEKFIVSAGKKSLVQVRVDHRSKCVHFGAHDTIQSSAAQLAMTAIKPSESDTTLLGEDVMAQIGGGSALRSQLQTLYTALDGAIELLQGEDRSENQQALLQNALGIYSYHWKDDYTRIMERRKRIEAYKESSELERNRVRVAEEQEEKRQEETRRVTEQKRLEEERKQFEIDQKEQEKEEMKRRILMDKLQQLQETKIGNMVLQDLDETEIAKLDVNQLFKMQVLKIERERQDQSARSKIQERKWDHWVRALNQEEIPLRQKKYKEWRENDVVTWEEHEIDRVARAKEEQQLRIETYSRLSRVRDDATIFMDEVHESRKEEMETNMRNWETKLEDEKNRRLKERKDQRKRERKLQYETEKAREKEENDRKKAETEKNRYLSPALMKERQQNEIRPPQGYEDKGDDSERAESDNWRAGGARPGPQQDPRARGAPPRGPEGSAEEGNWRGGRAREDIPPPVLQQDPRARGAPPRGPEGSAEEGNWRGGKAREDIPPPVPQQDPHARGAPPRGPVAGGPEGSAEEGNWRGGRAREDLNPPVRQQDDRRGPPPPPPAYDRAPDEGSWRVAGPRRDRDDRYGRDPPPQRDNYPPVRQQDERRGPPPPPQAYDRAPDEGSWRVAGQRRDRDDRYGRGPPPQRDDDRYGRGPPPQRDDDRYGRGPPPQRDDDRYGRGPPPQRDDDRYGRGPPPQRDDDRYGRGPPPQRDDDRYGRGPPPPRDHYPPQQDEQRDPPAPAGYGRAPDEGNWRVAGQKRDKEDRYGRGPPPQRDPGPRW